jgi:hypothetical protein
MEEMNQDKEYIRTDQQEEKLGRIFFGIQHDGSPA